MPGPFDAMQGFLQKQTQPQAPQLGGSVSTAGQSGTPGLLGEGMYQGSNYGINQGVMGNPNFQLGAYGNAMNGYIGNTTNPVVAAQAAGGNYGNFNTGTAGQLGMANQFQNMAAGNGPSMAAVQAKQQGAANLAGAESMLGSARGAGNPAAAQLAARNAQAQGAQQVAQNAVQGRTAEEMGAMNAAAGLYGNVAGQGLQQVGLQQGLNQFNAGQTNQVGMGNQANALAAYTNQLNSLGNQGLAQQQGGIAGQQLAVQQQLGEGQIGSQAYENAAKSNQSIMGGIMSGIGGFFSGI